MRTTLLFFPIILATALSACSKPEEPKTAAPAAEAPAAIDGAAKFAATCASCHGANGQGQGTFPKLAGLTADQVKAKLGDFKAGKVTDPQASMMAPIASMLSDAEIDALAGHIATLK